MKTPETQKPFPTPRESEQDNSTPLSGAVVDSSATGAASGGGRKGPLSTPISTGIRWERLNDFFVHGFVDEVQLYTISCLGPNSVAPEFLIDAKVSGSDLFTDIGEASDLEQAKAIAQEHFNGRAKK